MTIRVLLSAATGMVRSALHGALAGCEDIELVQATPSDPAENIDVVVFQAGGTRDLHAVLRAIIDAPHIGVVTIGKDGAGSLYHVDRQGWRFASTGQHGLADAVRAAARTP